MVTKGTIMSTKQTRAPSIRTSDLPPADSATLRDTTFFLINSPGTQLPSPSQVRERCFKQNPELTNTDFEYPGLPPAYFEELGLIVKFGRSPAVTVAEGQCLWALRRSAPTVPVPEVYGWTHDGGQVFIYMELIQGATLEKQWDKLSETCRIDICNQISTIVADLRKLRHAPGEYFLGHVNREPIGDIVFTDGNRPPAGPFDSVTQLHDWISWQFRAQGRQHWPGKEVLEIPDPYRSQMPDSVPIVFTHGDLHRSNIIISEDSATSASDGTQSSAKILAIIDWRQSGWYPEYWEFCKAVYTTHLRDEWLKVYIPLFLNEQSCYNTWDDYIRVFGC